MAIAPSDLDDAALAFLAERHLAVLTTLRPVGAPHAVPVGFGYDPEERVARVITFEGSRKVRNLDAAGEGGGRASLTQVDGGRWLSLEGSARVVRDSARVERAVRAYAARYGEPGDREGRVAIEVAVERVLGGAGRRRA